MQIFKAARMPSRPPLPIPEAHPACHPGASAAGPRCLAFGPQTLAAPAATAAQAVGRRARPTLESREIELSSTYTFMNFSFTATPIWPSHVAHRATSGCCSLEFILPGVAMGSPLQTAPFPKGSGQVAASVPLMHPLQDADAENEGPWTRQGGAAGGTGPPQA